MLEKAVLLRVYRSELKEKGIDVPDTVLESHLVPEMLETTHRLIDQIINTSVADKVRLSDSYLQTMDKLVGDLSTPHYSRIILEEPELNLFPQSQIDLTYDILKMINVSRDTLFINTHSPYILYALNNCMLGGFVKDKIDDEELLVHKDSFINPQDVSVWELRDGVFSSTQENKDKRIQDKEGLIRSNYFDRVMHNVMADFRNLMNYHD